ncbi:MAG: FecR domain-containing protein [Methyloceanibacter sp.]|nr:FecR domain-containing protein [Methyloceanibacter sp.]
MSTARAVGAFLALVAALLFAPSEAAANKVGVAAAVNPDAFSGGKQIRIGKSIFYNERISTDANGVVQVLLVDGSTFTVGKNSDVVIDKFVYNPNKQTGEIVTSFSKGSMRFIGGKISKNPGGVTINTPDGSLAIRGGMAQGAITPRGAIFSFLFGNEMVFRSNSGKVYTVFQPGYTLSFVGGTPQIRPTTPADIQIIMAGLSNSNTDTTGVETNNQPPQPSYVFTPIDFQQLIVDATTTRITGELLQQLFALEGLPEQIILADSIDFTIGGFGTGLISSYYGYGYGYGDGYDIGASTVPSDFSFDEQTQVISLTLREVQNDPNASLSGGVLKFDPVSANSWTLGSVQLFGPNGEPIQATNVSGSAERRTDLLCNSCDFMEFGTFEAAYSYQDGNMQIDEEIEPGWWIAGPVTAFKDLPTTGTASYAGSARGSIYGDNFLLEGPVEGRGNMDMNWNFANRSGQFSISQFKPVNPNYSAVPVMSAQGTMTMPGAVNRFSGNIAGAAGNISVTGGANGAFVTDGRRPAAGVIGNWGVRGPNQTYGNSYVATGVFGGAARR